MKRQTAIFHLSFLLLGLTLLAIGLAVRPSPALAEKLFHGEGKVLSVGPKQDIVIIKHGEIRGLMGPMVMAFRVSSPALLKGIKPGDMIKFTLKEEGIDFIVVEINPLGKSSF